MMLYVLAIFLPPAVVLFMGYPGKFLLNCLLTLACGIPGIIHALSLVAEYKKKNDNLDLAKSITTGFAAASHLNKSSQKSSEPVVKVVNPTSILPPKLSQEEELQNLKKLKDQELISEDEYNQSKRKILGI